MNGVRQHQDGFDNESSSEAEIAPNQLGGHQDEEELLVAPSEAVPKKRGRKKIEPKWSRVINLDDIEDQELEGHEIEGDMESLQSNPLQAPLRRQNNWRLLFCPKEFWERLAQ